MLENILNKISNAVYKWVLISLVFFLCGCGVGLWVAQKYYNYKMGEIVMVKGFVYEKNVYDVKVRP
jgi:hypothetical protein